MVTTLNPTWLHAAPVGSGPGAVRLPAVRCDGCDECMDTSSSILGIPGGMVQYFDHRVSPSVDLPEETCPTCGDFNPPGRVPDFQRPAGPYGPAPWKDCETCGGKGTITRLWHAVEQPPERGWCNYCDARGDHTTERHFSLRATPVVGYSDTQEFEVVSSLDAAPFIGPMVIIFKDGSVEVFTDAAKDEPGLVVTHEPWTQGLVPGDRVLRWESVVPSVELAQ